MKRSRLALGILILAAAVAHAGWEPYAPLPQNRNLSAVWGAASDDVYAVGAHGTIIHWDGAAWSLVVGGMGPDLLGVWGSSGSDVFIVGAEGKILHWDGSSWSPMTSGVSTMLTDVWGSGPNDVFAVGAGGVILHWNGSAWSAMSSGTDEVLWGVWGAGPACVFAVGGDGIFGGIHRWNGSTWSRMPFSTWATVMLGVWGFGGNDVWVVGDMAETAHYDGSGWRSVSTPGGYYDLWGPRPSSLFAVGPNGTIDYWDQIAWREMESGMAGSLNGVWGAAADDVWAVGEGGAILHLAEEPQPGYEMTIDMPTHVTPGDDFDVYINLCNYSPETLHATVFVFLDIAGEYWFWPSWCHYDPPHSPAIDYESWTIFGGVLPKTILSTIWPDTGDQSMTGIRMCGATLDSTMSRLYGDLVIHEWSFGPAK